MVRFIASETPDAGGREEGTDGLEALYDELHRLARARFAALPPGQTLQATALVHEVYMRLAEKDVAWDGRRHFFFAAARAMRDILVEEARRKGRGRHGGELRRVHLEDATFVVDASFAETLELEDVLARLDEHSPELGQLVTLRHYGGLDNREIAAVVGKSLSSVERRLRYARAWLRRALDISLEDS